MKTICMFYSLKHGLKARNNIHGYDSVVENLYRDTPN
jgi:hypothetical protein